MIIFFILFSILIGFLVWVYFAFIKVNPTCFDNIKNGDEEGVDCGGSCKEICSFNATKVNIFWQKTVLVKNGVANFAALIENPNYDYQLKGKFNIRIIDEYDHRFELSKIATLKPSEKRILFIPAIKMGERKPKKTFVIFNEKQILSLVKAKKEKQKLTVLSKELKKEVNGLYELNIEIENKTLYPQRNFEIVGVLYGDDEIVLNFGKTFINYIGKKEKKKLSIPWNSKDFDFDKVKKIEVYIRQMDDDEL